MVGAGVGHRYRRPKIRVDGDEAIVIAVRLSRAGYGTPEQVLATDVETVMTELEYENFLNEYQAEFERLNAPEKK